MSETQQLNEILGKAKTVRELLSNVKYSIDYFQREYQWQEKQIKELLEDLTNKFLEDFDESHERRAVSKYGHYFLGSIIISRKNGLNYIVDGQQRLTSLTLLLIFIRNRLHAQNLNTSVIDPLIYSEQFGVTNFNLQVAERESCLRALFEAEQFDSTGKPESIQNIVARYDDLEDFFPEELQNKALPFFADWLIENVHLVEITAFSDEDAYTIFETMNDRGLSLTPTAMLKGFLLANIEDSDKRTMANNLWRRRIEELNRFGKDVDADFFKAWLRSQYAESIRERKKGAKPEDFDRIGSEFHRWMRDKVEKIGLKNSLDYVRFLEHDFDFYSRQYLRLLKASAEIVPRLEPIYYIAQHGFTLQYPVLLAPLILNEPEEVIVQKLRIVATYLDILIHRRLWNFHSISYSTMQYAMFLTMRDIRAKSPEDLTELLRKRLESDGESFTDNPTFGLHQMNRKQTHRILARLTEFVEVSSGMPSHYLEYTTGKGYKRYEIEHIWADKYERHVDEFSNEHDWEQYRNRIGDLLILPKSFNGSYGKLPYEKKLPHYDSQNLLARSLNRKCYEHNPGFLRFVNQSSLPFESHDHFKKSDVDQRQELYVQLAAELWNSERLAEGSE